MRAGKRNRKVARAGITSTVAALAASSFAVLASAGLAASLAKPVNTSPPTIVGAAQDGKTLTATHGSWSNNPTDYDYAWRRCASDGYSCTNITGATGLTYILKSVDVGNTIRFRVIAKNADGQTAAISQPTPVVEKAPAPATTTTTTTTTITTPGPIANHRPAVRILAIRFVGARVYVRVRVCDDSRRRLNIVQRDSRRGVRAYIRRFRTLTAPAPCSTLTRSW